MIPLPLLLIWLYYPAVNRVTFLLLPGDIRYGFISAYAHAAQASYVIKFIALLQLDEKPSKTVFPDCCSKFRACRQMGYGDLAVLTTATKLSSIGLFSTYLIHMSLSPRSKSVIDVENPNLSPRPPFWFRWPGTFYSGKIRVGEHMNNDGLWGQGRAL